VKLTSPAGEKTMPVRAMFAGPFETPCLGPTEVVHRDSCAAVALPGAAELLLAAQRSLPSMRRWWERPRW